MLDRLLKEKTDSTLIQLARYTVVGGVAFAVDFSTLYVLTEHVGLHYLVSATLAFLLGLTTNYVLSVTWVFNRRKLSSRKLEVAIFAAIGLVGLALNDGCMWLFTEILLFHYLSSKILATAVVYFWNFFMRKYTLFHEATT